MAIPYHAPHDSTLPHHYPERRVRRRPAVRDHLLRRERPAARRARRRDRRALVWRYRRSPKSIPLLAAGLLGLYLIAAGATLDHRAILYLHIALAVAGLAILLPRWTPALAVAAALALALRNGRRPTASATPKSSPSPWRPKAKARARRSGPPPPAPTPAASSLPTSSWIPKLCGECHKDIYEQWKSSMHHFASFNNQFYRKSIEYMQERQRHAGSKWCAGCHDHAVFFNGRFERPIKEQIDTPEAQTGLGCMSCHSIVHVGSTMGNGDFTIEYPPLHELASSHNPCIRKLDYFLTYLNPEPHRRTFMKPFMREQTRPSSARPATRCTSTCR